MQCAGKYILMQRCSCFIAVRYLAKSLSVRKILSADGHDTTFFISKKLYGQEKHLVPAGAVCQVKVKQHFALQGLYLFYGTRQYKKLQCSVQ